MLHLIATATALLCSGCSDLKFVNQKDVAPENDPREDLVIRGLTADLTTGGLVQHRVKGSHAVLRQSANRLEISDINVRTVGNSGETQGITSAKHGTIFMADAPELDRREDDIVFAGGVNYRAPSKDDPTTDLISLDTDAVVYDGQAERFRGEAPLTARIQKEGQAPIVMSGRKFVAPRTLDKFTISGGTVAQSTQPVTINRYSQLSAEVNAAEEYMRRRYLESITTAAANEAAPAPMAAPTPMPEAPPVPKLN